jgi:hypothetical protein
MKLGATDFVRKPMTPEILRGALHAAAWREEEPKRRPRASESEVPAPPVLSHADYHAERLRDYSRCRASEIGNRQCSPVYCQKRAEKRPQ